MYVGRGLNFKYTSEISFDISESKGSHLGHQFWEISFDKNQ